MNTLQIINHFMKVVDSVYGEDDEDATEEEKIATKARQERMANAKRLKGR